MNPINVWLKERSKRYSLRVHFARVESPLLKLNCSEQHPFSTVIDDYLCIAKKAPKTFGP